MVQNCISMYLLFCWMYSVSNMTWSSLYLPFICARRITCSWTMDVPDVLFRFKVSFSIFSQFNFTSDHGNMCTIYDAKISIVFFPFSLSRPSTMTTTTTTQRMYFRGPFLLHFSSLPSRNVIICNIEPCNKYPLFDCDNCDKAKKNIRQTKRRSREWVNEQNEYGDGKSKYCWRGNRTANFRKPHRHILEEDSFGHTNAHTHTHIKHEPPTQPEKCFCKYETKNMKNRKTHTITFEDMRVCNGLLCVQFCVNHLRHLFFRRRRLNFTIEFDAEIRSEIRNAISRTLLY